MPSPSPAPIPKTIKLYLLVSTHPEEPDILHETSLNREYIMENFNEEEGAAVLHCLTLRGLQIVDDDIIAKKDEGFAKNIPVDNTIEDDDFLEKAEQAAADATAKEVADMFGGEDVAVAEDSPYEDPGFKTAPASPPPAVVDSKLPQMSGRFSSTEPNLSNVPKRSLVTAETDARKAALVSRKATIDDLRSYLDEGYGFSSMPERNGVFAHYLIDRIMQMKMEMADMNMDSLFDSNLSADQLRVREEIYEKMNQRLMLDYFS